MKVKGKKGKKVNRIKKVVLKERKEDEGNGKRKYERKPKKRRKDKGEKRIWASRG